MAARELGDGQTSRRDILIDRILEQGNLDSEVAEQLEQIRHHKVSGVVHAGSIVEARRSDGVWMLYILVDRRSAIVKIDDVMIAIISLRTPVAQALLGGVVDDVVSVVVENRAKHDLTIVEVR